MVGWALDLDMCGLLVLHLLLELGDLIPQLLDYHVHVNRGMLGTTGHRVWGFLYRAPRSWFWGDSSECLKSGYSFFWGSEGWSSEGFVDSGFCLWVRI